MLMECMMTTLIPIPNETGSPSAPPEETSFITSSREGRASLPRPFLRYALKALRDYPRWGGGGEPKDEARGQVSSLSSSRRVRGWGRRDAAGVSERLFTTCGEQGNRGTHWDRSVAPPGAAHAFCKRPRPRPHQAPPLPGSGSGSGSPGGGGRREAAAATSPGAFEAGRSRGPSRRHRGAAASPARASTEPARPWQPPPRRIRPLRSPPVAERPLTRPPSGSPAGAAAAQAPDKFPPPEAKAGRTDVGSRAPPAHSALPPEMWGRFLAPEAGGRDSPGGARSFPACK